MRSTFNRIPSLKPRQCSSEQYTDSILSCIHTNKAKMFIIVHNTIYNIELIFGQSIGKQFAVLFRLIEQLMHLKVGLFSCHCSFKEAVQMLKKFKLYIFISSNIWNIPAIGFLFHTWRAEVSTFFCKDLQPTKAIGFSILYFTVLQCDLPPVRPH